MQKIYRNLGNLDIARKCLSTCLIKSFKNNNHLIYLLSTCELAHLNFIFHTDIGEKVQSNTLEEKILSHSNSYINAFKNVLQYLANPSDEVGLLSFNPGSYFKYVYFSMILNLLREGYNSLAVTYLKIVLELVKDDMARETLDVVLFLLYEVLEFDTPFAVNKFYELTRIYRNEMISDLFITKLKFLRGERIEYSESIDVYKNIYYTISKRYFYLASRVMDSNMELEIIEFKNFCKSKSLKRFKLLANILLCKLYYYQGKVTEGLYIMKKNIDKASDYYIKLKSKVAMLKIFAGSKQVDNIIRLIDDIATTIEVIGSSEDKQEYYFIKSQYRPDNSSYIKALNNAICTCNNKRITNSFSLYKSHHKDILVTDYINRLIDTHGKLFQVKDLITLSDTEEIELYKVIHYTNSLCFDKIFK
jgi:hypothetical protein